MSEDGEQGNQKKARSELEFRLSLHRSYVGLYTKKAAFFVAINCILMKVAFMPGKRNLVAVVGVAGSLLYLVMFRLAIAHARDNAKDLMRLAEAAEVTPPHSTEPSFANNLTTGLLLVLVLVGWLVILVT